MTLLPDYFFLNYSQIKMKDLGNIFPQVQRAGQVG